MSEDDAQSKAKGLPSNAYTELKPGEEYKPVMPQNIVPEVTPYSVIVGLIMAVLFSAAAAYLGLKVGQVFEAAIPIAILAVGLSNALKEKWCDGAECNYSINRINIRRCSCRCNFYFAGNIYFKSSSVIFPNVFCFSVRSFSRNFIFNSF